MKRGIDALTSKEWWNAASTRAVKTASQVLIISGALGMTGDAVSLWSINWQAAVGLALGTVILSFLYSLAGLPEVGSADTEGDIDNTL